MQGRVGELRVDVGKAGELALVDVGDDQLVWRGQHGLGAREEFVKVLCSLSTLKERRRVLDGGRYFLTGGQEKARKRLWARDERLFQLLVSF